MRTIKLLALMLAFLLTSTLAISSNTVIKNKAAQQAQRVLYKNIRMNLEKWHVIDNMQDETTTKFVVYCTVDKANNLFLLRIDGEDELLKEKIVETFEKHPVKSSTVLHGTYMSFMLTFEKRK